MPASSNRYAISHRCVRSPGVAAIVGPILWYVPAASSRPGVWRIANTSCGLEPVSFAPARGLVQDYNSDVFSHLPPAHLHASSDDTLRFRSLSSSRFRGCAARRDEASSPTGGQPVNLWRRLPIGTSALTLALACIAIPSAAAQGIRWKLACTGKSKPGDGSRSLSGARYRAGGETKSFGFDLTASPQVTDSGCTSDAPFFVSVAEPEGNYRDRKS